VKLAGVLPVLICMVFLVAVLARVGLANVRDGRPAAGPRPFPTGRRHR
jgi:hypothetical protein